MSFGPIAGVTLAIAAVLVLGVTLLSYVSSLVKNAYQIKVELRSEVEKAIAGMNAEMARHGKFLRKDLGDDTTKLRESLQQDMEKRMHGVEERLAEANRALTQGDASDQQTMRAMLQDTQRRLKALERDVAAIKEDSARRAALGRAMRDRDREKAGLEPKPEPETDPAPAKTDRALPAFDLPSVDLDQVNIPSAPVEAPAPVRSAASQPAPSQPARPPATSAKPAANSSQGTARYQYENLDT